VTSAAAEAAVGGALDASALGAGLGAALVASEGVLVAPALEHAPTRTAASRPTVPRRLERSMITDDSSCRPRDSHAQPDVGVGRLGLDPTVDLGGQRAFCVSLRLG